MTRLILGTRGSKLALVQSETVAAELRAAHPGLEVELKMISTKGDRVLDVALSAVGDKGLFVKELEQALLDKEVDLCVHSCKDLPSELPEGLTLAAFPQRADVRDALVLRAHDKGTGAQEDRGTGAFVALNTGAVVGTSSLLRASQLRALRPDLELRDVRGNVDTRLRKLADGQYDAIVLAAAGLARLGLWDAVSDSFTMDGLSFGIVPIAPELMLPAVAQGVLAIEARADDATTLGLLAALDHAPTRVAALAERGFLRRLEGGCQVPIAAYAECEMHQVDSFDFSALRLRGLISSLDGLTIYRGERTGEPRTAQPAAAEAFGAALAAELLAQGAGAILDGIRVGKG
jgi:hydroxymethylbilane synthase